MTTSKKQLTTSKKYKIF